MKNLFTRHRESSHKPLFDVLAVLFGIFIFTLLVLPSLVAGSAYFDEGYSAYLAQFDPLTIAVYTGMDVHPPLYYTALHIWQTIVGGGVEQLRWLSVVFAWVAIGFGFLIVRRWFGQRAAWTATLLISLSPLLIRYGATMRMYTMALAIAFAATYVLLRAVASKDKRWWIAYTVLVAAGMWTNYFMALVWVTHALWLLYEYRGNKEIVHAWRKALVWSVVLYLPWLPMLLYRYGEIQVSGFWIKPISVDTLVSTVTQSIVFRSASDTYTWLALGVIALVVTLAFVGRSVYQNLDKAKKAPFRLLLAMTSLPVILLAVGSLPPLRSSFVYRYVIVAAVTSALVIAIIAAYAKFKQHDKLKRVLLYVLAFGLFANGAAHAVYMGNRNLDTDKENKLLQIMKIVHKSDKQADVVVRSPYSYYVVRFYEAPNYGVKFLYTDNLAKMGSTKPLADHPDKSVSNFDGLDRVWLVGEDEQSVVTPKGEWTRKSYLIEHDDITNEVVAAAAYYERAD